MSLFWQNRSLQNIYLKLEGFWSVDFLFARKVLDNIQKKPLGFQVKFIPNTSISKSTESFSVFSFTELLFVSVIYAKAHL